MLRQGRPGKGRYQEREEARNHIERRREKLMRHQS